MNKLDVDMTAIGVAGLLHDIPKVTPLDFKNFFNFNKDIV